ncbi:hypothetical protein B0H17DRAFT_1188448 [Mycena rosella]|uniref:Uncharacterized protein n=1 Tax=Mycena rosella TaxID=1033263 RepID=A0AAD7FHK6_MYCRO|nr:hypothetical protein B0H17DRAFT_1188448 [Mycena rosella]
MTPSSYVHALPPNWVYTCCAAPQFCGRIGHSYHSTDNPGKGNGRGLNWLQGALRGAIKRLFHRGGGETESDEELPAEYAHLPIYNAAELPKTAIRTGTGQEVAYHATERRAVVTESLPNPKRRRADSPPLSNFFTRQRKKRDQAHPSRSAVPFAPPLKRMRRSSASPSKAEERRRPAVLSLLTRKITRQRTKVNTRDSVSCSGSDTPSDSSSFHEVRRGHRAQRPNHNPVHQAHSEREVLDADEEWGDEDDAPSARLSGPDRWNPWPDGKWETTHTRDYFEQSQFVVHWACEVRGGKKNSVGSSRAKTKFEGVHTLRLCLGVMKCTNRHCDIITRPQTKNSGRLAQLQGDALVARLFSTINAMFGSNIGSIAMAPTFDILAITTMRESQLAI